MINATLIWALMAATFYVVYLHMKISKLGKHYNDSVTNVDKKIKALDSRIDNTAEIVRNLKREHCDDVININQNMIKVADNIRNHVNGVKTRKTFISLDTLEVTEKFDEKI